MGRSIALLLLLLPAAAAAHDQDGNPTSARPANPSGACETADASYDFAWTDYDRGAVSLTLISWYYSDSNPPAYWPGQMPAGLMGTLIAGGIEEPDPTNRLTWDTSAVPSGAYWLWSLADDPPFKMITFSHGLVVVAHPGDPVPPTVVFTQPDGLRDTADASFTLELATCDPDGTALVDLEATAKADGTGLVPIATGLPAAAATSFVWDTSTLCPGYQYVRATIHDGRGMKHTTFAQFEVNVVHERGWDASACTGAGGSGGSGGDGGSGGIGDGGGGAGPKRRATGSSGCDSAGGFSLLALLAPAILTIRRRRPIRG